ncbi:tripartite motif-containing protein 16-like, partial [Clarias magur]
MAEPKMKLEQRVLERKKELEELQKALASHKRSAQVALEESDKTFTEMICFIEKKRSEFRELIHAQEKIEVNRAKDLLKQMEDEITELQRQDEELQQLTLTEDNIYFLQRYVFLTATLGSSDLSTITVSSVLSFEEVTKSVIELKNHLEDLCKADMENIANK